MTIVLFTLFVTPPRYHHCAPVSLPSDDVRTGDASGFGTHTSSGPHQSVASPRRSLLRGLQQRIHLAPALLEELSLVGEGDLSESASLTLMPD